MMYICTTQFRGLKPLWGWLLVTQRSSQTNVLHKCYLSSNAHKGIWTAQEVRRTFIDYFKSKDHTYVPSSSVIAKKGDGSYFVNAGMNQFKPIFLGTVEPYSEMATYRRVVNSQKCIRIGGKHNDLDDVGHDTYHHTFFEMLGNWSFGDYFKKEACTMSWDLLTQVYGLPADRLYVTYFGGSERLGLPADDECRDIWREIGVSKDRVLPFGTAENFWDMGDTGPCGPCTEVHYDHTGGGLNSRHLVNGGHPQIVELCNLVFMQFYRQDELSLRALPCHHVDTGMGLERLCSVLQNTTSNYDTDLFQPLFNNIQQVCGCPPYQGRVGSNDTNGMDTAYRIIADHARMITVCLSDGLRPGRKDRDHKLLHIIHRCIRQVHRVMNGPRGVVGSLLPVVVDSLGDAFPKLHNNVDELRDLIDSTEEKYLQSLTDGEKALRKALNSYGSPRSLTAEQIDQLEVGHFGSHVPLHILIDLADDLDVQLQLAEFEQLRQQNMASTLNDYPPAESRWTLDIHDLEYLRKHDISTTNDSLKYNSEPTTTTATKMTTAPLTTGRVLAMKEDTTGQFVPSVQPGTQCGIILDRTCFYAEKGGQMADRGCIETEKGTTMQIADVTECQGYVLHVVEVCEHSLSVGDVVSLNIDQSVRHSCSQNHTAAHIVSFALNSILGNVQQAGSSVTHEKLTFDFTCLKHSVSDDNISAVSTLANTLIQRRLDVHINTVPLSTATSIRGICVLADQVYPTDVRVVTIGVTLDELMENPQSHLGTLNSVELCGGTHVSNTSEIGALVIASVQGTEQGTKRLVAVTGDTARQAVAAGEFVTKQWTELQELVQTGSSKESWLQKAQAIKKSFSGQDLLLPKVVRDKLKVDFDILMARMIAEQKNRSIKDQLQQELLNMLNADPRSSAIVAELNFNKAREIVDAVSRVAPSRPLLLLTRMSTDHSLVRGLVYVPQDSSDIFTSDAWAKHICGHKQGSISPPKGKKFTKLTNINMITFKMDDESDYEAAMSRARNYVRSHIKES